MCCCGKPTINGDPNYSWDGKTRSVYPQNPPDLEEGDTLIHDEPGRCGGLDSHSYHFRLVKQYGTYFLLVSHGGGSERIKLTGSGYPGMALLSQLGESYDRYWLMQLIYHVRSDAVSEAREKERNRWAAAIVAKKVKVRRKGGMRRVEIVD